MPYIDPRARPYFVYEGNVPNDAGQLNFTITSLVKLYLESRPISYGTFNEVIGVLECAKQELYRRVISPYEDQKCATNGDVYSTDTKL